MVRMTENEKRGRFEALYREHFRAMYLAASRALTAGGVPRRTRPRDNKRAGQARRDALKRIKKEAE